MNDSLKNILVYLLAISVIVFAWFGKIPTEAFTAFVSGAVMWALNSKKVESLNQENKELNEKISIMEAENAFIIEEKQIKDQN